jgi:hypothetical protein
MRLSSCERDCESVGSRVRHSLDTICPESALISVLACNFKSCDDRISTHVPAPIGLLNRRHKICSMRRANIRVHSLVCPLFFQGQRSDLIPLFRRTFTPRDVVDVWCHEWKSTTVNAASLEMSGNKWKMDAYSMHGGLRARRSPGSPKGRDWCSRPGCRACRMKLFYMWPPRRLSDDMHQPLPSGKTMRKLSLSFRIASLPVSASVR